MNWDFLFGFTNALAIIGWLALAFLPRGEPVPSLVLWGGVGALCATYAMVFVALMGGFIDPVRDGPTPPSFEYTVDGLKAMFAARGAIVVGWTHYLAFDLFVGLWIARDADERGVGRVIQVPFLFVTLMAGPIGLLAWLALRNPLTGRRRRAA